MEMKLVLFTSIVALGGCIATVPVAYRTEHVPVVRQDVTCQNVEWNDSVGNWTCKTPSSSTSTTIVTTETVVIDNIMYGIVGGMIAGYWLGNVWHHGVPRGFVAPHRYRHYHVAPRGYAVVPRGHVPRGFYGRRR